MSWKDILVIVSEAEADEPALALGEALANQCPDCHLAAAFLTPLPDEPLAYEPTVVAGVWAELLGRNDFPVDADFFAEGGDSLLITRLIRRVNNEFGIRVPVREMLARRTLNGHIAVVHRIQDESDR